MGALIAKLVYIWSWLWPDERSSGNDKRQIKSKLVVLKGKAQRKRRR